jgi:para-aminobenzoate synthetase component 1
MTYSARIIDTTLDAGDTLLLAGQLKEEAGFVWLDSANPSSRTNRYSVLSCNPRAVHVHRPGQQSPSEFLDHWNVAYRERATTQTSSLPFLGGWLGALYYDFGEELMNVATDQPMNERATAYAAYHSWAVIIDHHLNKVCWVDDGTDLDDFGSALKRQLTSVAPNLTAVDTLLRESLDWEALETRESYTRRIAKILHYLEAGDSYQVNYAQAFDSEVGSDTWALYMALRVKNAAPYGAYLRQIPLDEILCFSPELFLRAEGNRLFTLPIKGTSPRDHEPARDQELAQTLAMSPKNRAENVMIVDLLRNDFGRVCVPGSIRVEALCQIESYPSVHHLVSEIHGLLSPQNTPIDAIRATFPGGSITGAPKKRSMEIIRELEDCRRGMYCGSIFALSNNGNFLSNIAIRTMSVGNGKARVWGGGGIVADSVADDEYQETLHKLSKILK